MDVWMILVDFGWELAYIFCVGILLVFCWVFCSTSLDS